MYMPSPSHTRSFRRYGISNQQVVLRHGHRVQGLARRAVPVISATVRRNLRNYRDNAHPVYNARRYISHPIVRTGSTYKGLYVAGAVAAVAVGGYAYKKYKSRRKAYVPIKKYRRFSRKNGPYRRKW